MSVNKNALLPPFLGPEVEIVALPNGEAPVWVRQNWIGLRLPLATQGMYEGEVDGVVSGRRSRFSRWLHRIAGPNQVMSGYLIHAASAIQILGRKDQSAANWWRENTPDLLNIDEYLVFEAEVCRLVKMETPEAANE